MVKLIEAAQAKGDGKLADLITLAAYTGARIGELCGLRVEKVDLKARTLKISEAKTRAGVRTIPLHSALAGTMARLCKASRDQFVLSGLNADRDGSRTNQLQKRFEPLARGLGFDKRYVFHSIRKTVAQQLKDAEVPEFAAAAILGHDLHTMSYGVYAKGVSMTAMRAAIEKIKYSSIRKRA